MFKSFRFTLGVLLGAHLVGFAMSFDWIYLLTGKVALPQNGGSRLLTVPEVTAELDALADKGMEV
jgi:hypothetical protein